MVTGSARRSRYLDISSSPKISPLALRLIPSNHSVTPVKLQIPISNKFPNHSPLTCRQTNPNPYNNTSRAIRGEISGLLEICNQTCVLNFATTIENFKRTIEPRRGNASHTQLRQSNAKGYWKKIGEATYSEVFCWSPKPIGSTENGQMTGEDCAARTVMKVIPIGTLKKRAQPTTTSVMVDPSGPETRPDGGDRSLENEFPLETHWADALKEIKLARLFGSQSTRGFVDYKGCLIVSGGYPPALLKEWDKYRQQYPKLAENPRPSKFPATQLYCCLLLAHAGKALEESSLDGWQQAASILEQVTRSLSHAEEHYEFEHRDLHWGNLLINSSAPLLSHHRQPSTPSLSSKTRLSKLTTDKDEVTQLAQSFGGIELAKRSANHEIDFDPLTPETSGVAVSIIDYGLSRAKVAHQIHLDPPGRPGLAAKKPNRTQNKASHETLWTDPDDDIFGFKGNNDYQFDCYDLINLTRQNHSWAKFNPLSNVIWLHYLTKKLLEEKSIPKPNVGKPGDDQKDKPKPALKPPINQSTKSRNGKSDGRKTQVTGRGTYPDGRPTRKTDADTSGPGGQQSQPTTEEQCYELLVSSEVVLAKLIAIRLQFVGPGGRRPAVEAPQRAAGRAAKARKPGAASGRAGRPAQPGRAGDESACSTAERVEMLKMLVELVKTSKLMPALEAGLEAGSRPRSPALPPPPGLSHQLLHSVPDQTPLLPPSPALYLKVFAAWFDTCKALLFPA